MTERALVKFNSGRGALLCNQCRRIIRTGKEVLDVEDKEHFCDHLCRARWDEEQRKDGVRYDEE